MHTYYGYDTISAILLALFASFWTLPAHAQSGSTNGPADCNSSLGCAPIPPGLIAWWQAENIGTNLVDGNPTTSVLGASYAPGLAGQAFQFNDGVATVQDGQLLCPSNITIEGWFKVDITPPIGYQTVLVSKHGKDVASGWLIDVLPDLHPRFVLVKDADTSTHLASTLSITLNTWVHIAATYDGTNANIFIDGNNQGTASFPGGYTPTGDTMYIGGGSWCEPDHRCGNPSIRLSGSVDELSIYNRALDPTEIQGIYEARSAGKCVPGTPLQITAQPTNQTLAFGLNATYSVSVSGSRPCFYQWYLYPTNILIDQTNSVLVVSNVHLAQSGWYYATISNLVGSVISTNAALTINDDEDCNGNGIPNSWEALNGLDPCAATNAMARSEKDKLTYWEKYSHRLNPLTTDTDGDGISDYDEIYIYHSNPLSAFTSGDGIPDLWKVQHGMNPSITGATNEVGSTGANYLQVYQYNQDPSHTTQLDPRNPFFAPGTSIFEALNHGQHTNRFYYDRNDRLMGAEYSRGISIAYQYDGNGNLVHQKVLSRSGETNGLPVLWKLLNGLTNNASAYADTDGDGWTDYQEWKGDSNPTNALSIPNLLDNPGTNITSLQLLFTPNNFVVGMGQLDGLGAEEIVLGADGSPGTNGNILLVLTQGPTNWSTQRVDIGMFGITSIAIGQVTNRPGPAIYAGLRRTGGTGQIMEFINAGGVWQTNVVANSTNEAAFVLGVRGPDLLTSFAAPNEVDGGLYAASFATNSTNWQVSLLNPNTLQRRLGMDFSQQGTISSNDLRLVYVDGIKLRDGIPVSPLPQPTNMPANAVYRLASDKWYFVTPTEMIWSDALAYAQQHGGTLVAIEDASENTFVRSLVPSDASIWIGLYLDTGSEWKWTSGSSSTFRNWNTGEPNNNGGGERWVVQYGSQYGPGIDGKWNDAQNIYSILSVVQVTGVQANPENSVVRMMAPPATNSLCWSGLSLALGEMRGTNGISVFYCFVDDTNTDGQIGFGDDFVTSEYVVRGTNASLMTLFRQPISFPTPSRSHGLTSVDFLNRSIEVFFTGESDGQIFAWTVAGATNSLQRQLFTKDYRGKAWHALGAIRMATGGEGLVGLMVDPANLNTCNVIFWPPQMSLPQLPNLAETAPSVEVIPSSYPLGSNSVVTILLWDSEGNASTPFLQYKILGSTDWQNVRPNALDNRPYNTNTLVTALPNGVRHTLTWNALAYLGDKVATNILLRARARDFMLMGEWSLGTPFKIDTTSSTAASSDPLLGHSDFLPDGGFELTVTGGVLGQGYTLLASTNLVNWVPIRGYIFTNPPVTVIDPDAAYFPRRFYQIGPVGLASASSLGIYMAKPLNDSGFNFSVFSLPMANIRIEASTNLANWVTLTNLISTNSPFLFNDPAALHLQQRYYRLLSP